MHKRELFRLEQKIAEKGFALIPMRMYFKNGMAKLLIGLGKGKKLHDKRQDQRLKEDKREMERALKYGHLTIISMITMFLRRISVTFCSWSTLLSAWFRAVSASAFFILMRS